MNLIPKKPDSYPVPPCSDLTLILFGRPGSGKTSLCAEDPNTLFIATEPGQEFTKAAVVPCYDWRTFLAVLEEIKAKRDLIRAGKMDLSYCPYTAFVVDIVDNLAGHCRDFICQKKGLTYPPTNDFGKTWADIAKEWKAKLTELLLLGTVRFVTHCTTMPVTIQNEHGLNMEVDKEFPTFANNKMAQYLDGIVNAVGYMYTDKGGRHCVTFKQTAQVAAKDRTGILSEFSPMFLESPEKGWSDLCQAYEKKAAEKGLTIVNKRGVRKQ